MASGKKQYALPPKLAQRFLRWFLRDDLAEEVHGDLQEQFDEKVSGTSLMRAKLNYWYQVFNYLRPFAMKKSKSTYTNPNHMAMFKHNFIITFRNFRRNKTTFLINLIGLSTGLACTLLIYFWVNDELQVDKFNQKDSQLYQVMKNYTESGKIDTGEDTPGLLAKTLKEEMPEVENAVSVFPPADYTFKGILSVNDEHVKARSKFAGKEFFNIFSYKLQQGNKDRVLADPNSVVISEELARNLFHTTDNVVGKSVEWSGERNRGEFLIAGIFKSPPANATIQFDIVFNYDLLLEKFPGFLKWQSNGPSTYVLLRKNIAADRFNNKIMNFVKSKDPNSSTTLFIRPYSDRYLYSDYENGVLAGGRIEYVRLFSMIAILILTIACINFMNLSTAKATGRLKEIGVKKAIGASRKALIKQYLGESMLITLVSMTLAVAIVALFLPQFNTITGKQLTLHFSGNLIFSLLGITIFTGIIAGSYPAVYLSGFNPLAILKRGVILIKGNSSFGEQFARKGLVVFQFVISTLLIVSVMVVYQQMKFVQSKNLGFDHDNVISFTSEGKLKNNPETFLSEIKKIPGVKNASYMDGDLISLHNGTTALNWEGKRPDQVVDFEMLRSGYDLIKTLGIKLKEGRSFSRDFSSEDSKVIFNEAAIESMGLKNPIGKTVTVWGQEKQIIGVVKDFNFESLYNKVHPFFFMFSDQANNILVKIRAGEEKETLTQLGKAYRQYNLGIPFDFHFLDESYQKLYASENRVATLSRYFAGFTILISCLGLFGLAAYSAERRTKEIGIRKILGAGEFGIIRLLSIDFTKMVFVAVMIALPISFYLTRNWLDNFAYKIDLQWWYFIAAGSLALVVAWFTVGLQTVKAARINPVESLKDE